MINNRLSAARARCEAATPGPWFAEYVAEGAYVHDGDTVITPVIKAGNADFISNAREDLPWALDQIAELTKERDLLKADNERIIEAIKLKGGTENYPTEDAYIYACRALDKLHVEIDRLEKSLAALEIFDGDAEATERVIALLKDENELRAWIKRCAWHCKKVHEQAAEIDRLTEAQRWIPTSERLPTAADADVFHDVEVMDSAGRKNVWYWGYVNSDNPKITHWRKILDASKGESRAESKNH